MPVVRGKIIEPLFTPEMIAERNRTMAAEIAESPKQDLLVISILKGSFIFAADLIRALHDAGLAPEVEFITLSSYGKGTKSQGVKIIKDIDSDVRDRDILLIDDILESGRTLRFARDLMYERGARNVDIAVLLDKRSRRGRQSWTPSMSGLNVRIFSLSAMAWMWLMHSASCHLLASSRATLEAWSRSRCGKTAFKVTLPQGLTPSFRSRAGGMDHGTNSHSRR